MQDLLLQYGRGLVVFIGKHVVDGRVQCIADMDQGGQGDLDTVVLYVADVAGVYVGNIGDVFLGEAFGEADFTYFASDSVKVDFFHWGTSLLINLNDFI